MATKMPELNWAHEPLIDSYRAFKARMEFEFFDDNCVTIGHYVGYEALQKRQLLKITSPISYGVVTNWDDLHKVLDYAFKKELMVNPQEHPILLTEPPFTATDMTEYLVRMLFDKFNPPAILIRSTSELILRGYGIETGLVLESGYDVTYAVPIVAGKQHQSNIHRMGMAGRELTELMRKMLSARGLWLHEIETPRRIKEEYCYIAYDIAAYRTKVGADSSLEKISTLINEQEITLDRELFEVPEVLFNPTSIGLENDLAIHEIAAAAIGECDSIVRDELYANIVLAGGSTTFPGLTERLEKELLSMVASGTTVKVTASEDGVTAAWIGGSKLASDISGSDVWISREEYNTFGPSVVFN